MDPESGAEQGTSNRVAGLQSLRSRRDDRTGAGPTGAEAQPAGGSAAATTCGLAPRVIVFHPDHTFCIAIDPLRVDELEEADEDIDEDQFETNSVEANDPAFNFIGWQLMYKRHKNTFLTLILVDIAYLMVLLGLRLSWGPDRDGPDSPALQFLVGEISELKVAFLAVAPATDAVAGMAAARDYSPLLSCFVLWSVVLTGVAVMIMPLLFLFLRVALVVAAFQLRYSLARFRNLLPPNTASEWLVSAGQGIAQGARGLGQVLVAPFWWTREQRQTRRAQQQQQQQQGDIEVGAVVAVSSGTAQRGPAAEVPAISARAEDAGQIASSIANSGSSSSIAGAERAPSATGSGSGGSTARRRGAASQSEGRQARRGAAEPGEAEAAEVDIIDLYLELRQGFWGSSWRRQQRGSRAARGAGAPAAAAAPAADPGLSSTMHSSGSRGTSMQAEVSSSSLQDQGRLEIAQGSGSAAAAAVELPLSLSGSAATQASAGGRSALEAVPGTGGVVEVPQQHRRRQRRRGRVPLLTVEVPEGF